MKSSIKKVENYPKCETKNPDYVLGFLFSRDLKNVLLIRKNRPDWQKGKLNGIGGKIEKEEGIYDAMIREFKEETGYYLLDCKYFLKMVCGGSDIHCFVSTGDLTQCRTMEDEEIINFKVEDIFNNKELLDNLGWIVNLALYNLTNNKAGFVTMEY